MTISPDPNTWNIIRRGSKGPDVAAWQTVLEAAGHSLAPYGADGSFGGLTERKTKLWQETHGLASDGIVGPRTRAEIDAPELADTLPPESPGGLIELLASKGVDVIDESVAPRPNQVFVPQGIIIHHTAAGGTQDAPSLSIIRTGRPYLNGPLAPLLIGRLGAVYVCCDDGGVCNHAGPGRSVVLDKVRRGEPLGPEDVSWGVQDSVGGNRWFYGVELENAGNGIEPFGAEQYESALAVTRALIAKHDWGCYSVIAHHEWSRRKIDPNRNTFNIQAFREAL